MREEQSALNRRVDESSFLLMIDTIAPRSTRRWTETPLIVASTWRKVPGALLVAATDATVTMGATTGWTALSDAGPVVVAANGASAGQVVVAGNGANAAGCLDTTTVSDADDVTLSDVAVVT